MFMMPTLFFIINKVRNVLFIDDSTTSYGCHLDSSGSINLVMNLTKLFLLTLLKRQRRISVEGMSV